MGHAGSLAPQPLRRRSVTHVSAIDRTSRRRHRPRRSTERTGSPTTASVRRGAPSELQPNLERPRQPWLKRYHHRVGRRALPAMSQAPQATCRLNHYRWINRRQFVGCGARCAHRGDIAHNQMKRASTQIQPIVKLYKMTMIKAAQPRGSSRSPYALDKSRSCTFFNATNPPKAGPGGNLRRFWAQRR